MLNPSHPGEILRDETLPQFKISVAAAARALHYDRATLHKVLSGKAPVTPELAVKVEKAFGVSADLLVKLQAQWDLARVRERSDDVAAKVERQPVPAAT